MEKSKITKKMNYVRTLEIVEMSNVPDKEQVIEFLQHEVELLNKKSSRGGATKEMQETNRELKQIVYNALVQANKAMTATELLDSCEELQNYTYMEKGEEKIVTNQKVSSLLKKLIDEDNLVTKVTDKKKTYFSIRED